jgi:hypothetical protein
MGADVEASEDYRPHFLNLPFKRPLVCRQRWVLCLREAFLVQSPLRARFTVQRFLAIFMLLVGAFRYRYRDLLMQR